MLCGPLNPRKFDGANSHPPKTPGTGPSQFTPDSEKNFYKGLISPDINNVSLQPTYRRSGGQVFCHCLFYLFYFIIIFRRPCHGACGILVPQTGIEPVPPAMEVRSPNHWTTGKVPFLLVSCQPLISQTDLGASCLILRVCVSLKFLDCRTYVPLSSFLIYTHVLRVAKGCNCPKQIFPGLTAAGSPQMLSWK